MNKFSKALEKIAAEKKKAQAERVVQSTAKNGKPAQNGAGVSQAKPKVEKRIVTCVDSTKVKPCIISLHDPRSRISEQYRTLRTNLKSMKKKSLKTLVVSSSIESEGKTVTALNLAFTFAQDKSKKILLLDADLRRSKSAEYLGLHKKRPGFIDVLEQSIDFEDALVYTEFENLHILPGKANGEVINAAELLGSQEMKRILAMVRDEYDYVIIDSPPIIPVTDAAVLGTLTDGVLLVFRAEKTQRNTILHAQNMFKQAEADVIGYIMTSVQYLSPGYKDYYYYSYN